MSDSVQPHRQQPTRLLCPWDSPGKNTGVGCHFLLQCMKVKSESEVAQSCPTLSDPMDFSLPGSSVHRIFQARVLEWGAIVYIYMHIYMHMHVCIYLLGAWGIYRIEDNLGVSWKSAQDWKLAVALRCHLRPYHQSTYLSWMALMPISLVSLSIKVMGFWLYFSSVKIVPSLSIAFLQGFNLLQLPWHIIRRKSVFSVTFSFSGWVCTRTSLLWLRRWRLAMKASVLICAMSCIT